MIKSFEIRTSMLFNLDFADNSILLGIPQKWDPGLGTRDPGPGIHRRDLRPGIFTWDLGPETLHLGPFTLDPGSATWDQ